MFSGALRNAFRGPRNSPEKSPEKLSGLLRSARQDCGHRERDVFSFCTNILTETKYPFVTAMIIYVLGL